MIVISYFGGGGTTISIKILDVFALAQDLPEKKLRRRQVGTADGGTMGAISIEQLLKSPAGLIAEAESGQIAIVTKNGRPLFLAVPYDERLAKEDVHVAVAVRLYENEVMSLGKAARIAGLSISEFIDSSGR